MGIHSSDVFSGAMDDVEAHVLVWMLGLGNLANELGWLIIT